MFDMLINHWHLGIAGIGPMIFHWGLGIGLIILILLVEVFSGAIGAYLPFLDPFLKSIRKDLLWAAAVVAVFLGGEAVGAHDANTRNSAKQVVVNTVVNHAVKRAGSASELRDRWNKDGQP